MKFSRWMNGERAPGGCGARRGLARPAAAILTLPLLAGGLLATPAEAAITSVNITGGPGTAKVDGTLYARQGQTVSISVVTDLAVCKVVLSGAHSGVATASVTEGTTKTWNLGSFTVGSGDATRSVTATETKVHKNDPKKCNNENDLTIGSASYVADNTAPTITPTVTSGAANNTTGWSNQDVTVNWSGSDTGSGFVPMTGASPNPAPNSSTQSTDTSGITLRSTGVDRVGNTGDGSQFVKLDKTEPDLKVPSSPVIAEATSDAGAVVSYNTSAGDVLSGPETITPSCSQASGSTFPLGNTTVSCSATDVAGNTATKPFTVTVRDTTGPVFSNVPSIDAVEGDTLGGKEVTWTDPTATDTVSGPRDVTCTPPSGTLFPVGTTTVDCTATDAANNSTTASFDVIVSDTTKPVLVIPESLEVEATSSTGAQVNYDASAEDIVDGDITPVCDPASGAQLALGDHTIGCDATDRAGNMAEGSFVASVVDTTKPVFGAAPVVAPFEATAPGGAAITYIAPEATDAVSGTITGSCSPASGTVLAIGTHTVTCNASDQAGLAAEPLAFTVTVRDTTAPAISHTPANQTIQATSADGATASFTAPTAEDIVDGPTAVTCDKESGATFPIGTTTVTCSTVDSRGNGDEVQFTIKVEDTTAPTLTVPDNITVEATGSDGAEVTFTATASDTVDPAVSAICAPQTGSLFPMGTTIVTCNATDTRNNSADPQTFTVTVQDTKAPVISGTPANQTIQATGPGGATATFTAPTANDIVDGPTAVTCNKESGATFPLGTTTVTCSTVDSNGNPAAVQFTIEVVDTTAPTLTVPANITVNATSAQGAEVTFTATASDTVDPAVSAICAPQTGSLFPVGTTTVTCNATDAQGNAAAAKTFTVTVNPWLTYNFGGFKSPVDAQPTLNRTKAGSAVPVKFSLGANHGLDIWSTTGPTSGTMTCSPNVIVDAIEETVTAGGSSLQYDSVSNTYTYVWKTDAKWANTCRQLVLKFKDGTIQRADFNFIK